MNGMLWFAVVMGVLYGYVLLVAALNLLLMRRPKPGPGPTFAVLIPARNEADNLRRLIPELTAQKLIDPHTGAETPLQVFVFDDESDDGTAEVAAAGGATVLRASEPLPPGWTGKNRACHLLAQAAAEASPAEWWVFLDADVYPEPTFAAGMQGLLREVGARCPVVSGFPRGIPGEGVEPVYLSWVSWVLLATNPFGLVSRTGKGHSRFTNGQITAWKASLYTELWPNERLKGRILEDVLIGRLLAQEGKRVEVANLASFLAVRMYRTLGEALNGMSKNSYEITGSVVGTFALAAFFMLIGIGWLGMGPWLWHGFGALLLSKLLADRTMRGPLWVWPLMPLTCLMAAYTMLRSWGWHRAGKVEWKGRTYGGKGG